MTRKAGMGYNTHYDLDIDDYNEDLERKLSTVTEFRIIQEAYQGGIDAKWYGWEQDMKTLSELFPETVFHLTGRGERSGDMWKADFKGGKMQFRRAVITYPEYDETWGNAK